MWTVGSWSGTNAPGPLVRSGTTTSLSVCRRHALPGSLPDPRVVISVQNICRPASLRDLPKAPPDTVPLDLQTEPLHVRASEIATPRTIPYQFLGGTNEVTLKLCLIPPQIQEASPTGSPVPPDRCSRRCCRCLPWRGHHVFGGAAVCQSGAAPGRRQ